MLFFTKLCLFFLNCKNLNFWFKLSQRVKWSWNEKSQLRDWNEPTDYKQFTMFVQQYSIFDICERIPRSEQPIYWDCVRNAGSQIRCCTTLYVARCLIVLSCAVCNKDKVSATLWRLKELFKCVTCVLWSHVFVIIANSEIIVSTYV